LNFVLEDGVYGAGVPDVGDNYGYAGAAFAIFGYQQFEWLDGPTSVSHKLQAALNSFFGMNTRVKVHKILPMLILMRTACKDNVNGVENYVLKWGVQGVDGKPPVGCYFTELTKNFDIPGGAKGSST
jgi:hypothetical protein